MKFIVSHFLTLGYLFDSWEQFWVSQDKPPTMMEFELLFKTFQIDFETHLLQRGFVFLKERTKPNRQKAIKRD